MNSSVLRPIFAAGLGFGFTGPLERAILVLTKEVKMMKKMLTCSALLLAAGLLSACGTGAKEEVLTYERELDGVRQSLIFRVNKASQEILGQETKWVIPYEVLGVDGPEAAKAIFPEELAADLPNGFALVQDFGQDAVDNRLQLDLSQASVADLEKVLEKYTEKAVDWSGDQVVMADILPYLGDFELVD